MFHRLGKLLAGFINERSARRDSLTKNRRRIFRPRGERLESRSLLTTISLTFTESVTEGQTVYATLTLDAPAEENVSVHWYIGNDTAVSPDDYDNRGGSGATYFPPGETQATFPIETIDDEEPEGSEKFTLTLSDPFNAELDATKRSTIVIYDNDTPPTVSVIANAWVYEGTKLYVTAMLSAPHHETVVVDYSTQDGTATAPWDYQATNGTLTFQPNTRIQTFEVQTVWDSAVELDDTFTVLLSNPQNAVVDSSSSKVITTMDNDTGPGGQEWTPVVAYFPPQPNGTTEGTTATFQVSRGPGSGVQATQITLEVSDGSAVHGSDYGGPTQIVVDLPERQEVAEFSIPILHDTAIEPGEDFFVAITQVVDGEAMTGNGPLQVAVNDIQIQPVDDEYFMGGDSPEGLLVVLPYEGVRANDLIPPLFEEEPVEIFVPPESGTLQLNADGSFDYRPDPFLAQEFVQFEYWYYRCIGESPLKAKVTIWLPGVNLSIYDGQNGDVVGDVWLDTTHLEETRGAFTVANLNDTDADGIKDSTDTNVVETPAGVDEVDLMQLVVYKPFNYTGGAATLSIDSGEAVIWKSKTKGGENNYLINPSISSTAALTWSDDNPKTFWVEATAASVTVRDIHITFSYQGSFDSVRATGVWVDAKQAFHDLASASDVLNALKDPVTDQHDVPANVVGYLNSGGGTGLRPYNSTHIPTMANAILMQWEVKPPGLATEPVNIDIARRANGWMKVYSTDNAFPLDQKTTSGLKTDRANDDPSQDDESSWTATRRDHAYSFDDPGVVNAPRPQDEEVRMFVNFNEYVRIGFKDKKPKGDTLEGSRASDFWPWHVSHTLFRSGTEWARDPDDVEFTSVNDVGPGHITIPPPPE